MCLVHVKSSEAYNTELVLNGGWAHKVMHKKGSKLQDPWTSQYLQTFDSQSITFCPGLCLNIQQVQFGCVNNYCIAERYSQLWFVCFSTTGFVGNDIKNNPN